MKVFHVLTRLGRDCGGPVRSVQGLVAALAGRGVEAWLISMKTDAEPWIDGVRHCRLLKTTNYWECKKAFAELIDKERPDIVHLHNIWNLDIHAAAVVCRKMGVSYICAPRGSLEPWALRRRWLKKWMARVIYQDFDLSKAAALHATAESEAQQFRRLGFSNHIIVSHNGINVPKAFDRTKKASEKRALFLSRMNPKKGVIELIEAWAAAAPKDWNCELVYTVGTPAEAEYEIAVRTKIEELSLGERFRLTGPLNDEDKWAAYARARLFILPTYSENFGIVVAEALWAGVPVITTKGTPWHDIVDKGCGWWIDTGVNALSEALKDAFSKDIETLSKMGDRGRALIEDNYSWGAAVGKMIEGYEYVLRR